MTIIQELIDEFNKKYQVRDLVATLVQDSAYLKIDATNKLMALVPLEAVYIPQCTIETPFKNVMTNEELAAIDKLIKKVLGMPTSKLLSEPKYVVMPENLDSSRGPQCLTADVTGRVFFAAKKNGLKQKFSFYELQDIINQTADETGISWLTPVINKYKKLVE